MDRRTALKLFASLSGCVALPPVFAAASKPRVTVIGAGIVGSSAAYHLSKAGAEVTVIDQQAPASHSTLGTFAWLNASWAKQPKHYHYLNQLGLSQWRALQAELSIPIDWHGSIEWFESTQRNQRLSEQILEQQRWGERSHMIHADTIRELEPNIVIDDATVAAFAQNDGAVDPVQASKQLLDAAVRLGAKVYFPEAALAPVLRNDRLIGVETNLRTIPSDFVVIASGADPQLPERFSGLPLPQRSTPGVIAFSEPTERILHSVVAAPGVHLHQRADGVVVIGEQDGPPKGQAHTMRLQNRPNRFPNQNLALQHGKQLLTRASQYFPALQELTLADVVIGWRPLPLDGHPVLGTSLKRPEVYIAVMHSGVCLGPLAGKIIASELIYQKPVEGIEQFRPDRQFASIVRY